MNIERTRTVLRYPLAAVFAGVSFIHLRWPSLLLPIMPDWVPYPYATIIFTGICELAGAIGLLTRKFRYLSGIMLTLYAVCVFPANIKHALSGAVVGGMRLGWWYHGPRLAFEPVMLWWCLFTGGVVDWPFTKLPKLTRPAL